jgi:hypothetical protein
MRTWAEAIPIAANGLHLAQPKVIAEKAAAEAVKKRAARASRG